MGVMEPRQPFCSGPSSAGSAASRFAGTRNRGSSDRGRACRADGRREPASITHKPIGATRAAMRGTIRQVQGVTSNSPQVCGHISPPATSPRGVKIDSQHEMVRTPVRADFRWDGTGYPRAAQSLMWRSRPNAAVSVSMQERLAFACQMRRVSWRARTSIRRGMASQNARLR